MENIIVKEAKYIEHYLLEIIFTNNKGLLILEAFYKHTATHNTTGIRRWKILKNLR